MARHPCEKFIKFLLMQELQQQTQPQDGWVQYTLSNLGFPTVNKEYVDWWRNYLRSKSASIKNLDTTNRFNQPTMSFLKEEGIYLLFFPDKSVNEANGILTNMKVRQTIESLLLGRLEPKDVAKKVNARYGEHFTADGIAAYSRYYWNTAGLSVEDWSTLLDEQSSLKRSQAFAIVQSGPAMALHLHGFQQYLESKTILKKMLEAVSFDFDWWKTQPPSLERTRAFGSLSRTACSLDTQLSSADAAMKETLKAFEQFRMKHANSQVGDIREIASAGNFTGSGAKLIEAPIKPEDIEELEDEPKRKRRVRVGGEDEGPG